MRSSKAVLNQLMLMRAMRSQPFAPNDIPARFAARNGNLVQIYPTQDLTVSMAEQDPETDELHFWNPPSPHGGERNVASKSSATKVGVLVSNGREVEIESSYEQRAAYVLQARRGFVSLRSQYPVVPYLDAGGVVHRHYFDALASFENGTRLAVAVKPESSREEIEPILEQIKRRGSPLFDDVELITDTTASISEYQNAMELLLNRGLHIQADVDRLIADLRNGPVRVIFLHMLYSDVPLPARRAAIWRLIDLGILSRIGSGRISYDTEFNVRL